MEGLLYMRLLVISWIFRALCCLLAKSFLVMKIFKNLVSDCFLGKSKLLLVSLHMTSSGFIHYFVINPDSVSQTNSCI